MQKNIFAGIVWEKRYDGSYEISDSYTGKTYIAYRCVGGKYALHGVTQGVSDRMTKLEIAQYIAGNR